MQIVVTATADVATVRMPTGFAQLNCRVTRTCSLCVCVCVCGLYTMNRVTTPNGSTCFTEQLSVLHLPDSALGLV